MTLTRDAILKALEGVTVDALVTKVHADIMATDIERELLDAGLEISPIKNSLKELVELIEAEVSNFDQSDNSALSSIEYHIDKFRGRIA